MLYSLLPLLLLLTTHCVDFAQGYSALEDARLIAQYRQEMLKNDKPTNHAKVARRLVHQTDWSAVGSLSTNTKIQGFPMVNMISLADSAKGGKSTGIIYFMLTDLDFTGSDWRNTNKITFFFSDEQLQNCKNRGEDAMEPTCARAIISGQVQPLNKNDADYNEATAAFTSRHPQANNWIKVHSFYMCKLNIENIFVLDWYGGPHDVPIDLYYNTDP